MKREIYEEKDTLIIGEDTKRFHAVIGNVQTLINDDGESKRVGALLTNIRDEDNSIQIDKEWFYNKTIVKLAKKNYEKQISFTATCKRMVIKPNGKIKLICIWSGISDIELGIN